MVLAGLCGAGLFVAVQLVLLRTPQTAAEHLYGGWFLNSGRGVATVAGAMAIAGLIAGLTRGGLMKALALAGGAAIAMAATLVAVGPGNLFPIVLVFGGAVIACSVVVPAVAATILRQLRG